VGGNIRDGISGMSSSVMSKPKELAAQLLKHKSGKKIKSILRFICTDDFSAFFAPDYIATVLAAKMCSNEHSMYTRFMNRIGVDVL
jgi:hypothetical protein